MVWKYVSRIVLIFWILSLPTVFAQVPGPVEVTAAVQHDVSEELRNVPPRRPQPGQRVIPVYHIPAAIGPDAPDPVLQTQVGPTAAPAPGLGFEGLGQGFPGFSVNSAPPDTNGAVGATQYVQWVNESFAVFNKTTGALVYGPAAGNTLWTGFGGNCETTNDGDPIVQYDKAANRWIFTQFSVNGHGSTYYQCVAVSQTSDATGPYYRYAFTYSNFNDYPKLGVWPDAYYVTFNMFRGNSYLGPKVCAWDRAKMLVGAAANQFCVQMPSNVGSMLPADLDGSTPPPAGAPNYLLTVGTTSLSLYKFHVDFTTTSNSTLTGPSTMTVAAFTRACGGGTCIPQLGTQQLLDSLGDRLMYRLAYRNFGDHASLVVNHSITAANATAVRWYEIRNPAGTPLVYQQGTYAPDTSYRWMGSIAMDGVGNMALGYSVSSSTLNPSIRYTVRAPGDPLGQMGSETVVMPGTGSQTSNLNRWGDYSSMSIDPVDDCTFWYTTEYLKANGTFNWSTRIASFTMPTCTSSTIQVNVQTSPAGLQIVVDGTTYTAPHTFTWVSGASHTIATSTPQGSGGTRYAFASWSDAGAMSHTVAPTTATTYTANFTTQYLLTTSVSPAGGGTISPNPSSVDGYYNAGTSVQLSAATNAGYAFLNWSGDVTGALNPASVVMSAPRSVTANFNLITALGLRFVPVTPCRVVDTRNANSPFGGPVMTANSTRSFAIPAGSCGIPATALAYSFTVTVMPTSGFLDYLTIWPTGQAQPLVSTLNSYDGRTKSNAALIVAGTAGAVSVFVTHQTHVILDINGYFALPVSAPAGLAFYPLPPCRVMDTRLANGPFGGPILSGGVSRTVPVRSSSCGVPATAVAYSLNMTVVPTGALAYLNAWATGTAQPGSWVLTDPPGTVVANAAIVAADLAGSIDVYASDQTHLIIDVNGYFAPPATGGLLFYAAAPCRVVDTRLAVGPFGGPSLNGPRDFNIAGGACTVPAGTQAYSFNTTLVPPGFVDYLTLWPQGQAQPLVSTLNSYDGSIVSNAAIVPTINGSISAFSSQTTDVILDLNGFFAP
jgi:List-Bact-rpt repeat protein